MEAVVSTQSTGEEWGKIGASKQVVCWLKYGLTWEFSEPPVASRRVEPEFFGEKRAALDLEFHRLQALGCFERLQDEEVKDAIISFLFPVEKPGGGWRAVLDFTPCNKFTESIHFKMENIRDVRDLIQESDYMTTFDLKDAYLHLHFKKEFRKYTAFSYKGKLFKCISMMFGITHGPRWWTKVMKCVSKYLRTLGIRCIVYIDDILVFHGRDFGTAVRENKLVEELLLKLGLSINLKKSQSYPMKRLKYLGFIVDSELMKIFAPEAKIKDIKKNAKKLAIQKKASVRALASFLGKVSAVAQAVLPWRLCTRALLLDKNKMFKQCKDWETVVELSSEALVELTFWINQIQAFNGRDIKPADPKWITISDSSKEGFAGANLPSQIHPQEDFVMFQEWSTEESLKHNNYLETISATEVVREFILKEQLTDGILLHKSDNSVAVSYFNKQGGRVPEISRPVEKLWQLCLERGLELKAEHVPGESLLQGVDFLSRMGKKQTEWKLPSPIFQFLKRRWGPFTMDCFASQFNNQMTPFMSWWRDPKAIAWDAMTQIWPLKSYLFPPFLLIGRILKKIQRDRLEVVLISPMWIGATWWPQMMSMAMEVPVILPAVLIDLQGRKQQLKWNLLGWRLSGMPSDALVSKKRLSTWSTVLGETHPRVIPIGEFSRDGVEIEI
eukprot:TRINITY_DN5249_c0_g1_i2.p1 TRINITY_DN5249_c0_g1~~TRINITY_DN5249_c0_g1_i2.p1  ORF type:complete len:670 (-),score=104.10 TRINITY_DN5249_c0_g1_i2:959-2968(-)